MLNEKQIHPYPVHGCNKSDQLYEFLVQLPLKATNWEHFVQVRLLVTGAEGEERAFEVAHEVLLLIFDVPVQRSSAPAESARLIGL